MNVILKILILLFKIQIPTTSQANSGLNYPLLFYSHIFIQKIRGNVL